MHNVIALLRMYNFIPIEPSKTAIKWLGTAVEGALIKSATSLLKMSCSAQQGSLHQSSLRASYHMLGVTFAKKNCFDVKFQALLQSTLPHAWY